MDIGKHTRRPTKHAVFKGNAIKNADIVLYFNIIANRHIWPDHNILSERAILAQRAVYRSHG